MWNCIIWATISTYAYILLYIYIYKLNYIHIIYIYIYLYYCKLDNLGSCWIYYDLLYTSFLRQKNIIVWIMSNFQFLWFLWFLWFLRIFCMFLHHFGSFRVWDPPNRWGPPSGRADIALPPGPRGPAQRPAPSTGRPPGRGRPSTRHGPWPDRRTKIASPSYREKMG